MAQTIDQVFASKKLWQWYNSGVTKGFDGVSEKGQDYSTSWGAPVAVPIGGMIVRIVHNNNSINDVVELQSWDGSVWLYQHINVKVNMGQAIGCGDVIGTENGLPIDQYSSGPHIEVRYCAPGKWDPKLASWNEPWMDPKGIFGSLGTTEAGKLPANVFSGISPMSNILAPFSNPLKPNASVTDTLAWLDRQLVLNNPFVLTPDQNTAAQIPIPGGGGSTFTDPISYVADVAMNFAYDMHALVWRAAFIALGIFIMYKIINNFIDLGAVIQTGTSLAKTAAMAAAI